MRNKLLFAAMLLCMLPAAADNGQLYTTDKLSSGLVTSLCQDRYGFIWVGTEYGLNKFDGYRYTAYFFQRNDSTSLPDNEVATLFTDRQGQLWVGCAKGLARYNYERDAFERFRFPDDRRPRVNSFVERKDGTLLIGTAGYGLYSIAPDRQYIHYEEAFSKRRQDDFYSRMHQDREGNLWRSSHRNTFTKFTVKNGQPVALRDYESLCGQPMRFLERNRDELLIVCMRGIMSYHYSTGEVTLADFDLSLLDSHMSIEEASRNHQGNIYIGTSGSGLMMIPANGRKLVQVENANGQFDLATNQVADIIEDKDQNLWVACYNRGLMLLPKQKAAFRSWDFANRHPITGGGVSSIAAGDNGTIYCTIQNNGVFQLDSLGHVIAHPAAPIGTRLIYRDQQGQYWLCTENVLYRYHPATNSYTEEKTFSGRGLNSITDDGKGHLYISVYGVGLCVYDTRSRQADMLSMQQTHRRSGYLCNDWIKSLTFDSHGQLWLCTANGVSAMRPDGFVFNHHGWNSLLDNKQCFAACETAGGDMLIGTESGMYRYDRQKNKVSEVPEMEALHDKMICAMVRDQHGDIWISTTLGIWQYNRQRHLLTVHIGGNGLSQKEYILGARLHTADDRIFFGTANGITTFLPRDINAGTQQLGQVHLTRFIVNGHTVNPLLKKYRLRHADNTFTLEFSLLDYKNPENIAFQYRVNGADNWLQTNEGVNQITFNQLPSGKYTLEVRATNNGIFSDPVLKLHIEVLQPWYRSTWAYLLYFLVVTGIIGLIIFNFERQRRRDLEETKMRFLINATHDIRSPLTLIMGPLQKLKQRITDAESQADINTIDKNANRLLLLVNQILDERKIDKHQMKLCCTETDLAQFIHGIYNLYEYNARQRNINFTFEHPNETVKVWIDRINFDKVISNLLSNAFKYTFDGGDIGIRMSAPTDKNTVAIEVIDSGLGFEDDKTDRFFERFYQGKNSKDLHIDGTGIGLNLSRAITEMHGGTITAQNRKDGQSGAILTVTLPLGKAHLKPEEIEETTAATQRIRRTTKQQASRNFKILIVDDDEEIYTYIRHELGEWYKFSHAPNGREALKMLLTQPFDLVVSDVMMPEMDGITLLRSIKSNINISHVPVILLTSKSEVAFRLEGLKKGADAFLAKPFAMEELHILIDNLVDNVRRLRGKFSGAQEQEDKITKVEVKGNDETLMERVMHSINKNLSNADFGVEQLTQDVGISRAQLHRKMKELTGISTSEFIRNLRLEQAARLIKENKINITQVAYAVGFNNQTHFSTVFKRHFGMTPTEYAEKADVKHTETQ